MKTSTCQCFCSWRKFLEIPAPPAHSLKLVNNSPSCTVQALFKLLPLCWISEWVSLCVCPLTVESQFLVGLWLSRDKPHSFSKLLQLSISDFQSQMLWQLIFPMQIPRIWDAQSGAWNPCFSGRTSSPVTSLRLVGYTLRAWVLARPHLCPSYPYQCGLHFTCLAMQELCC